MQKLIRYMLSLSSAILGHVGATRNPYMHCTTPGDPETRAIGFFEAADSDTRTWVVTGYHDSRTDYIHISIVGRPLDRSR